MLDGLTYTTFGVTSMGGLDFGHRGASFRSPYSSFDSIWELTTSMAGGGRRKHAALVHDLASDFIARAAAADLRNDFADCFDDGLPALFLYHDGGEDMSVEPTSVVAISPTHWRLQGSQADPWQVSYSGLVFDLQDMTAEAEFRSGFWNDAWMRQTSLSELESDLPDAALRISTRLPEVVFADPRSGRSRSI